MRLVRLMAVLATLSVAAAGRLGAQSATGAMVGWVADAAGNPLPGATITITERATDDRLVLASDARGSFHAGLLQPGVYDVNATFPKAVRGGRALSVSAGQLVSLRVRVPPSGAIEIDSIDGALSFEAAFDRLPIANRQALDLVRLTPAATDDVRLGTLAFLGQRGTLTQYVVDGLADGNRFLGRPPDARLVPSPVGLDAIYEIVVNPLPQSAAAGGGTGTIAVVTKSGTNERRGSGFWSMRDDALDSASVVDRARGLSTTPSHADQFGGTLGGPLRRSRAFYFASYDGDRRSSTNTFGLNVPAGTPLTPANQQALDSLAPFVGDWTPRATQRAGMGRIDLRFAAHRLSVHGRDRRFMATNLAGETPEVSLDHSGGLWIRTRSVAATLASTARPSLLNELRAQVGRDHQLRWSNSVYPETIVNEPVHVSEFVSYPGASVIAFGRDPLTPRDTAIRFVQGADTVTWMRGSHTVSGGGDVLVDRITDDFPRYASGSYTFHDLAALPFGWPTGAGDSYVQTLPTPGTNGWTTHPDTSFISAFVQDAWRPSPTVSVDAGLRYERQRLAQPGVRNPSPALAAGGIDTSVIDTDSNNWGPRARLSWRPRTGRVIIGGGAGVSHGRTPALLAAAAHANNGVNLQTFVLTSRFAPIYPDTFSAPPSSGLMPPVIQVFERGFQQPRFVQANGGVAYASPDGTIFEATISLLRASHLTRAVDGSVQTGEKVTLPIQGRPAPAVFDLVSREPRLSADLGRLIVFEGRGDARYAGLTLQLSRQFGASLRSFTSYTFSRAVDTVNDATAAIPGISAGFLYFPGTADDARFPAHPGNAGLDRATGDGDQPHQLVAVATWTPPTDRSALVGRPLAGWTVTGMLTARSGLPYSALVDGDVNGDGNARNDVYRRRNAMRMPAQASFDLRVMREIAAGPARLQLLADVFNLFDARNITAVDDRALRRADANSPPTGLRPLATFGRPLATTGPRSGQLGIRVTF